MADSTVLASTTDLSPYVNLWDIPAFTLRAAISDPPNGSKDVALMPDGSLLGVVDDAVPYISIYDVATGTKQAGPTALSGSHSCCDFSSDGVYFAVGHGWTGEITNGVQVFNVSDWSEVSIANILSNEGYAVRFSPDATFMAVGQTGSNPIVALDVATWSLITPHLNDVLSGSSNTVCMSNDNAWIAGSSPDEVVVWDMSTKNRVFSLSKNVVGCEFSPDDSEFAVAVRATDGVEVYDTATWTIKSIPSSKPTSTFDVRYSVDGKYSAVSTWSDSWVYDTPAWTRTSSEDNGTPGKFDFDGSTGGPPVVTPANAVIVGNNF